MSTDVEQFGYTIARCRSNIDSIAMHPNLCRRCTFCIGEDIAVAIRRIEVWVKQYLETQVVGGVRCSGEVVLSAVLHKENAIVGKVLEIDVAAHGAKMKGVMAIFSSHETDIKAVDIVGARHFHLAEGFVGVDIC